MSIPLSTIIKGNLFVEIGHDTADFGFGDATINRSLLTNSAFANANANVSLNATTSSNFTISSSAAETLTFSTTGDVNNQILLDAVTSTRCDAIKLLAQSGGIEIDSDGTGIGCGVVITSVDNSSWTTTNGSLDFTVNSSDVTDNLTITNNNGTNTNAIDINSGGGIDIDATGGDGVSPITIDTNDTTNGVTIATGTAGVPVTIGTATSTTTVVGDFTVSGTTTTVDSQTLTIEDNIILVNSGPSGTADGGTAIKRFQDANDSCTGDVVSDTPSQTSAEHAADTFAVSATATTIVFNNTGATPPSAVDDFYNGWWICISGGTGANQARRIKDYDGTTRTATIFSTADETATPQTPATGLDWTTIPDNTSTYNLFGCSYTVSIYDESADEWVFGCSALDPAVTGEVTINMYTPLHAGDTTVEGDLTVTGTINGTIIGLREVITLVDNSTTPVEITLTNVYGAYMLLVQEVATNDILGAVVPTGAFATFMASARSGKAGNYARLTNAKGADGERLDIDYNSGEKIKLHYRPDPSGAGANRYYLVRILTL